MWHQRAGKKPPGPWGRRCRPFLSLFPFALLQFMDFGVSRVSVTQPAGPGLLSALQLSELLSPVFMSLAPVNLPKPVADPCCSKLTLKRQSSLPTIIAGLCLSAQFVGKR